MLNCFFPTTRKTAKMRGIFEASARGRMRKITISWIFVSADAIEISGGQRSQSVLGALMFLQRRVIL
jgi:hypothetical protein